MKPLFFDSWIANVITRNVKVKGINFLDTDIKIMFLKNINENDLG